MDIMLNSARGLFASADVTIGLLAAVLAGGLATLLVLYRLLIWTLNDPTLKDERPFDLDDEGGR